MEKTFWGWTKQGHGWMDGQKPCSRRYIAHGKTSNSQDAQNTLFGEKQIQDTVEKL